MGEDFIGELNELIGDLIGGLDDSNGGIDDFISGLADLHCAGCDAPDVDIRESGAATTSQSSNLGRFLPEVLSLQDLVLWRSSVKLIFFLSQTISNPMLILTAIMW